MNIKTIKTPHFESRVKERANIPTVIHEIFNQAIKLIKKKKIHPTKTQNTK